MRTSTTSQVPAVLIAALLAVASLAPVAKAEDPGFAAKMNVPFAFHTASGQTFAPGVYTMHMNGQVMLIRGTETAGLAMTQLADDGLPATQGKAVFTHYGDQYFLHTVSVAGASSHLLFRTSKAERQSQIAAGKPEAAVEVGLLREGH
jgi:hypothetical protein